MAKVSTVTYECETCGTEFQVTASGEGYYAPIYCCGLEVKEVVMPTKKAASKKKTEKKSTAKKKVAKKKPASKKKIEKAKR